MMLSALPTMEITDDIECGDPVGGYRFGSEMTLSVYGPEDTTGGTTGGGGGGQADACTAASNNKQACPLKSGCLMIKGECKACSALSNQEDCQHYPTTYGLCLWTDDVCERRVNFAFQGTDGNQAQTPGVDGGGTGIIQKDRPKFAKFKQCPKASDATTVQCENCATDATCGWQRSGGTNELNLGQGEEGEYVAEFWAECAEKGYARWTVEANNINNALIKVYIAEDEDHMSGELQQVTMASIEARCPDCTELEMQGSWGFPEAEGSTCPHCRPFPDFLLGPRSLTWSGNKGTGMKVAGPGSTRLYVVIKANLLSDSTKVELLVRVNEAPDSVGDCLDFKMCLSKMGSLRNDNAKQLQCLQGGLPSTECSDWTACLDDNQVDKARLQALLAAGSLTASLREAKRKETPETLESEVTGECMNPGDDDPESWECECHEALDVACVDCYSPGNVVDTTCLEVCYLKEMCDYPDICDTWKDEKCQGLLLSRNNVSVQEDVAVFKDMQGRRQPPGSTSSFDPAELDESISAKAVSKPCR